MTNHLLKEIFYVSSQTCFRFKPTPIAISIEKSKKFELQFVKKTIIVILINM